MTLTSADPRQARRDAKLASILDEAWTLARRDGLAAISLRDLADRVDLRQPSLYVYFESKLDLYDAMFADGYRQLLDVRRRSSPDRDDPRRALHRVRRGLRAVLEPTTSSATSCSSSARSPASSRRPSPTRSRSSSTSWPATGWPAAGVSTARATSTCSPRSSPGSRHQQVANDPGGERWVRLAGRVVEMFLADVDRRRQTEQTRRSPR